MKPSAAVIRQHDTHSTLAEPTTPDTRHIRLDLDAIIVPASRPAANLEHAVTLARAAGCWLLVLCSQQCRGAEVRKFLAARSYRKAIVIDLPAGYSHKLLSAPALLGLKDELPQACAYYVTDLSMKRNLGLVLTLMLGWRHVVFLDDDIRDITYPDLQSTVNMLDSFTAAGLWVTNFPDNSIVCHANRMTGGEQDVFVSGAALAVNCGADIGFFPDIYNEDWLFFFDDAASGRLANSCLKATQLCYYPFAQARRAEWQEFGDVLAEGLYALLHLNQGWQRATRGYWETFLEVRRNFLEDIITRSYEAHPDMRAEMLESVRSALKCLLRIKPDLCERYVQLWRQDLDGWKRRTAEIPEMPSIEAALDKVGLASSAWVSGTGKIPLRRDESANVMAGPVVIPRFDTLRELSERAGTLGLHSTDPAELVPDTKPLPIVTPDYSEAMLAARTNGDDSTSSYSDRYGRHRKQRFGNTMSRLGSIWDAAKSPRRAPALPSTPPSEMEPVEARSG